MPFAARPTDTVAPDRAIDEQVAGQTVIVENVGGAGGTIGVARAKPTATLLLMHIGISTSPSLYRNLRYDPMKDWTRSA